MLDEIDADKFFGYQHLPRNLQHISKPLHDAYKKLKKLKLQNSTEYATGLRKLLEAKDCFVRAGL